MPKMSLCQCICQSVRLSLSLPICQCICQSVRLSLSLPISQFISLSVCQLPIEWVLLVIFEIEEVLERTEILIFIKIVRFSQFRIHKKQIRRQIRFTHTDVDSTSTTMRHHDGDIRQFEILYRSKMVSSYFHFKKMIRIVISNMIVLQSTFFEKRSMQF